MKPYFQIGSGHDYFPLLGKIEKADKEGRFFPTKQEQIDELKKRGYKVVKPEPEKAKGGDDANS